MTFSRNTLLFSVLMAFLFVQGCDDNSTGPNFSTVPPPFDRSAAVRDSTLEDNITLYILDEGTGPFEVAPFDPIVVRFTARTEAGEIIESTYRLDNNSINVPNLLPSLSGIRIPSTSPLNLIQRIDSFRKAFLGMKEGGKRILEIPPSAGLSGRYPISGVNLEGKTITIDFELLRIQM